MDGASFLFTEPKIDTCRDPRKQLGCVQQCGSQ